MALPVARNEVEHKTEMCKRFLRSQLKGGMRCHAGDRCQFAHSIYELEPRSAAPLAGLSLFQDNASLGLCFSRGTHPVRKYAEKEIERETIIRSTDNITDHLRIGIRYNLEASQEVTSGALPLNQGGGSR